MLVVLSFCHKDYPLALENAEWIASLDGSAEHPWLVACNQIAGQDSANAVAEKLRKKYSKVDTLVHYDSDERPWPHAQNHAFQRCAQYVSVKYNQPWLWLECDAIPLKGGWIETLENEYKRAVRPFMGMLVDVTVASGQQIPKHMSGVAIYPPNVSMHSVAMMRCSGIAFDMAGAEEVLPQAHFTRLIMHKYQAPSITRDEEFDAWVPKEAVLFHQQKDASLIEYLRNKKNRDQKIPFAFCENHMAQMEKLASKLFPTVDIFIKTWPRDYEWLYYCMMSIEKFATGFRRIVFVSPNAEFKYIHGKVVVCPDKEPGYLWQQVCKLHADKHSDADYILFMDSDCVFTRPVTPQDFIRDGKVVWGHKAFREDEQRVWAPVIGKWMNEPATRSFMTGHPFVFPRWLFASLREYCLGMHKQELADYVMAQADPKHMLTFSEFNCAGAWAYKYARDKFIWEDRDKEPENGTWVHQGFTHGGEERKQQDIDEFKRILESTNPDVHKVHTFLSKKLEKSVEIVQDVKYHVNALAEYCKKDGFAKGRVVKQLRSAGIIPKK